MRFAIWILFIIVFSLAPKDLLSQFNSDHPSDTSSFSLVYKDFSQPILVDTAESVQFLVLLINNDIYNSLYLDPNRNKERLKEGYDFNRSQNFHGIFKENRYTVKSNYRGGLNIHYWYSGKPLINLSRKVNIHF